MTRLPCPTQQAITDAVDAAQKRIPPAWPLESSVAVNPFLGQANEPLEYASARLARIAGLGVTPGRNWYRQRYTEGQITREDLKGAIALRGDAGSVDNLVGALDDAPGRPGALPMISDLAGEMLGLDASGLAIEQISTWAAGLFDQGQALWVLPDQRAAWSDWCSYASHDLTPEIFGLKGFAAAVDGAPSDAEIFIAATLDELGLPELGLESYCHQLLFSLGGWAQLARYRLWQAELQGRNDTTLRDMLAIRLFWERALFRLAGPEIETRWAEIARQHAAPLDVTQDMQIDACLQLAAEIGAQRRLQDQIATPPPSRRGHRSSVQAAFCIDVRSEVFRRALESVDESIETIGFAGFFGLATAHRGFASDTLEHRHPVLLNPDVESVSGTPDQAAADRAQRYRARAVRAWGRFKLAAVSSFAFVESTGPLYLAKLFASGLGLEGRSPGHEPAPRLAPGLDPKARIDAAETILRAMSLTDGFARLVLITGHGASVVNNPHESALHCGACGGYAGDVNARLLAGLLNAPDIREGLAARAIAIPEDTVFVAGLHDTTTDTVTLFSQDVNETAAAAELAQLRAWLREAGPRARGERAGALPNAGSSRAIARRSRDWAEIRPEWGLAGCMSFIAAPRTRTKGKGLSGRAFLHDYDWHRDEGDTTLELILTAPVIVASWISLQYYASTVAPDAFGAGNKLLHNVVGGVGVIEGNGGALRVGLPWQSISDGERLVHEPLRLSVAIEAPRAAMTAILKRHPEVRDLFDHGWLHLFAMDENGVLAWRYCGDLEWTECALSQARKEIVAA